MDSEGHIFHFLGRTKETTRRILSANWKQFSHSYHSSVLDPHVSFSGLCYFPPYIPLSQISLLSSTSNSVQCFSFYIACCLCLIIPSFRSAIQEACLCQAAATIALGQPRFGCLPQKNHLNDKCIRNNELLNEKNVAGEPRVRFDRQRCNASVQV